MVTLAPIEVVPPAFTVRLASGVLSPTVLAKVVVPEPATVSAEAPFTVLPNPMLVPVSVVVAAPRVTSSL